MYLSLSAKAKAMYLSAMYAPWLHVNLHMYVFVGNDILMIKQYKTCY